LVDAVPGASVPVERGHRPEYRTATLGSAGNEAAAAQAAIAADAASSVEPPAVAVLEPAPSPPRPAAKVPRPVSPVAPLVVEEDPLEHALLADTPPPLGVLPAVENAPEAAAGPAPSAQVPSAVTNVLMPWAGPAKKQAAEQAAERGADTAAPAPKPTADTFGQTLPLSAVKAPPGIAHAKSMAEAKREEPKRSDVTTQPPQSVQRPVSSRAPSKAAPKAPPPPAENGSWLRTGVFAILAAGASYYGVTMLSSLVSGPTAAPSALASGASVASAVAPVPSPVVSAALAPTKPQVVTTQTPLPPDAGVPKGNGLLEIQVPEGTPIRVDGEYLGMGPARRVPLPPGQHELTFGDGPPLTVTVTLGERTLTSLASGTTTPVGSP
jgi:hypothetical protein